MVKNNLVILISGLLSTFFLYAAYATHRHHKNKGKRLRYFSGLVIGGGFALALTIFIDSVLLHLTNHSFFKLLEEGSFVPASIFLVGAIQGIIYEYVGSFALGLWYYPTVRHKHLLFLVLPFFWALFMIIMQDTYAVLTTVGLSSSFAFILTALLPFALIEGINIYTKSWIYQGVLKSPIILAMGWMILSYTFAYGFNQYIYSPFGY